MASLKRRYDVVCQLGKEDKEKEDKSTIKTGVKKIYLTYARGERKSLGCFSK